jgi:hypothetical protein
MLSLESYRYRTSTVVGIDQDKMEGRSGLEAQSEIHLHRMEQVDADRSASIEIINL